MLYLDDHPAFLPLGVCYHAADACRRQPLAPGIALWCVMSRLYGLSDRRRIGNYRAFWRAVHYTGAAGTQPDYIRSAHAHTEWHGLLYSVGLQPHLSILSVMHEISREIAAR